MGWGVGPPSLGMCVGVGVGVSREQGQNVPGRNRLEESLPLPSSSSSPKFMDCFMIGRDLVRLLQNVARIPEFEQLWKDIVHNPQALSPQFTGRRAEVGGTLRTSGIGRRVTWSYFVLESHPQPPVTRDYVGLF